jgi:hypothetical protein
MPVCPRCDVVYLDGESHACVPKQSNWLAVVMVGGVLLWIASGTPLLRTIIVIFMEMIGVGKMILGGLLARLFR